MNYASRIVNYLAQAEGGTQVLLAPGAPPVSRKGHEFAIVANNILTPQDIRETLTTFATHTAGSQGVVLGSRGVLSFGMPNLGRFRVRYFTQRGSNVVSVWRVPFDVPSLDDLVEDPAQGHALAEMLAGTGGGIVLITGDSPSRNVAFVYALLRRVNDTHAKIIYILEQDLSFLLRHAKSVVAQTEVDTDVSSLDDGIRNGVLLAPDIMYVRDTRSREQIAGIVSAAESGTVVLLSLVAFSERALVADFQSQLSEAYGNFCGLIKKVFRLVPAAHGKISLHTTAAQWGPATGVGT